MTLRQILTKAIEIICDDEIDLDSLSKKRDKLLSCGKMILSELTEEYVPLRNKETLNVTDGRIYYSEFGQPLKEVLAVYSRGVKADYKMYPLYLTTTANGEVEVSYLYHIGELSMESEVSLPPQYTDNLLAIGTASEFFYRSGLVDEAIFYKNRYDNALNNISRKRGSVTVKTRRII